MADCFCSAVYYARHHTRAVIASVLMLVMPFLLVGSCNTITIADLGNIATNGMLRDNPVLAHMSEREQARYVRTLADLVTSNPQTFLQLVDSDVELLLQEPGLKRAEGSMQVWQYRNDTCVLDLYIGGDEDKRVLDYEVRERLKARIGGTDDSSAADATCLHSVLALRATEPPVVLARLF